MFAPLLLGIPSIITNILFRGAKQQESSIQYKDRLVKTDKFVVGIDPKKFDDILAKTKVQERIAELKERYKDIKVIIGVDRLDYIKGLVQKLKGFEKFLLDHPEWMGKVVLIQVAVPSREDVAEYQNLESEISCCVGKINGKLSEYKYPFRRQFAHTSSYHFFNIGSPDSTPIIYLHRSVPFTELSALYSIADACLLSSTRDGMNLVAFEYIACQANRYGVLVLSEFAGASAFMQPDSINFHPANLRDMSEAIHRALTMSDSERTERYERLRKFVDTHTR
jgi:trehalose 6-phosphate synthase